MSPLPIADNFFAASVLSWALPLALLLVIAAWFALAVWRHPAGRVPGEPPADASEAHRAHWHFRRHRDRDPDAP